MKLIILDRDGVINQDSDQFIKSADEWVPIEGSLEAITQLNHAGYKVAIATNQSGLARGYFDLDSLNQMHQKMNSLLNNIGGHIDGIFFCPHHPDYGCDCRKPKPGLYEQISNQFNTPLGQVFVIGDSLRDLEAAIAVNASPILVRTGKGLQTEQHIHTLKNCSVFDNLKQAVEFILS